MTMILLDTNIILRSKQPHSPEYSIVTQKISQWALAGEQLVISPQTIYEFYSVATRPIEVNGLGLTVQQTHSEMIQLQKAYHILPENEKILPLWIKLVTDSEIKGKKSHDARLVAFMQSHQIKQIYTLNTEDFKRFEAIIQLV
jgi:predicted nucleic acid-binding protein